MGKIATWNYINHLTRQTPEEDDTRCPRYEELTSIDGLTISGIHTVKQLIEEADLSMNVVEPSTNTIIGISDISWSYNAFGFQRRYTYKGILSTQIYGCTSDGTIIDGMYFYNNQNNEKSITSTSTGTLSFIDNYNPIGTLTKTMNSNYIRIDTNLAKITWSVSSDYIGDLWYPYLYLHVNVFATAKQGRLNIPVTCNVTDYEYNIGYSKIIEITDIPNTYDSIQLSITISADNEQEIIL